MNIIYSTGKWPVEIKTESIIRCEDPDDSNQIYLAAVEFERRSVFDLPSDYAGYYITDTCSLKKMVSNITSNASFIRGWFYSPLYARFVIRDNRGGYNCRPKKFGVKEDIFAIVNDYNEGKLMEIQGVPIHLVVCDKPHKTIRSRLEQLGNSISKTATHGVESYSHLAPAINEVMGWFAQHPFAGPS